MKRRRRAYLLWIPIVVLVPGLDLWSWQSRQAGVEAFATGLNPPRGLAFDDAGNLYVAEASAVGAGADGWSTPITTQ